MASKTFDPREAIGISDGGSFLADEYIQILQRALDISGSAVELGTVAQENFTPGVLEHGISDIDLLPIAIGCDAIGR